MLLNHWYIACASSRLQTGPVQAQVGTTPLALFRGVDGRPYALLDRCCHRQAPLSCGVVDRGRLRCPYHGWTFDGNGACVHIPSLPETTRIPRSFAVGAFPCVEADDYVWVWMGDGAPVGMPPPIPCIRSGKWVQGVMSFNASANLVIENNLDATHLFWLHRSHSETLASIRRGELNDRVQELRLTESGFVAFSPPTAGPEDPVPEGVDSLSFDLPGRIWVRSRVCPVSAAWQPEVNGLYNVFMHVVSTGPRSCRLEYLCNQVEPEASRIVWEPGSSAIFEEDAAILEAVQQALDAQEPSAERSVAGDTPALTARQILRLAAAGQLAELKAQISVRQICRYRF